MSNPSRNDLTFELLVFQLKRYIFGINLGKVWRIINRPPTKFLPQTHPAIQGIFESDNQLVPLIDLAGWLQIEEEGDVPSKVIMTRFYNILFGLPVHSVHRIYRSRWQDISSPESYSRFSDSIAGTVLIHDQLVTLLDYEKIILSLNPGLLVSRIQGGKEEKGEGRGEKKVWILEDSATMRKILGEHLKQAGYKNVTAFTNPRRMLRILESPDAIAHPQLIISDIELPGINGYTLSRKIRKNPRLAEIPIILFASVISPQDRLQGELLNLEGQILKSDMEQLVPLIDRLVFP